MVAAAVAAGLAAAACRTGKSASDSAAVSDTAAASRRADSVALPASGAPGTAPSPAGSAPLPNGARKQPSVKPAAPATARKPAAGTTKEEPSVSKTPPPADTNPRPSNQAPAGATTPALVVFRDSLTTSDLGWLRSEGFTIVNVQAEAHSVSVRVPQSYHGNPKANPRVLRFIIAMR